jgi:uncharacterized SAM-binding protein YcdF (DUF218 family)
MLLILGKTLPSLFFPLGLALWTSALAWLLIWRGRRALGLCLGALSWAWLYAASTAPLSHALMAPLERPYYHVSLPETTSALVLLGGAVTPAVPPRTQPGINAYGDRLLHTARLWRQHRAPRIVTTGGRIAWINNAPGSEAKDYATLLTSLFDVDRAHLFLCDKSQTTRDDAVEVRRLFDKEGWPKDIILVTSAFHLRRATALFQKQGFTVHPAPAHYFTHVQYNFEWVQLLPDETTLQQTYLAVHEWTGYTAYRLLGWI